MAARRNADHIASGKAQLQCASLHEAELGDRLFDTIFAINLPVFLRGRPGRELDIVRRRLAPGGRLYTFSQSAPQMAPPKANHIIAAAQAAGFHVVDTRSAELATARVLSCTLTASSVTHPLARTARSRR